MPYAVLVSALGAIVASATALFGLQSSTALKVAPVVGALLGLLFAVLSLRRHDLPLSATVDSYRAAAGVSENQTVYLGSALAVGLVVSLIELPSVMLGQDVAFQICIAGWMIVLGGTVYRSWRLNGSPGGLDVFQITAGIACLIIFGWMTYVCVVEIIPGMQSASPIDIAKGIFILNGLAAVVSAVLACFGLAIISNLGARIDFGR